MLHKNYTFGTTINCMDGRTRLPVTTWMKENYQLDFVDMITEPGLDKILYKNSNIALLKSIRVRLEISIKKHQSRIVSIVGYYDCAGNPNPKQIHKKHIIKLLAVIRNWFPEVKVIGLWVSEKCDVEIVGQ